MTLRRARLAFVGTFVFAAVVLTACGDGDLSESREATDVTSAATEKGSEDEIDLRAILLRVDDLPEGWQELTAGSEQGGSCLDALFGDKRPLDPQVAETATFGASSNGPFLVAWVVGEPTSKVLVEINDVVAACDGTTAPSGFTTTIDATPVSGLPDDSLSVHGADVNESGTRIGFTLAGSGSDRVTVVVFAATPLGEIDDATIASAITAMMGRIPPS